MAIKGAQFYTDEAAKSGRSLKLGQSIGLARLMYLGKTYEDAMESARNGSIFLFRNFHSKFYPQIPETVEPLVEAGMVFAGTVDDIRRRLSEVEEKLHPEYFLWVCDQGYLPIDEVKRQLELFGTRVMNEFKG
jgi:alkanesulfonate monooxygenase SsuD/methylene tetrahydromethanopterin reductase-like flavin-dependent oxidoreductase (luciferase family)